MSFVFSKEKICLKFIEKLSVLKTLSKSTAGLRTVLKEIHESYQEMRYVCSSENKKRSLEYKDFEFVFLDKYVIGIIEGPKELLFNFIGMEKEKLRIFIKDYLDYPERICDVCFEYFLKPYYETPTLRIKYHGKTLALHPGCRRYI